MAEQNYKNHTRWDPALHFTLIPLLFLLLLGSIWQWWQVHSLGRVLGIAVVSVLFWLAGLIRVYALKVQNRVIRMEETLRMRSLGVDPEGLHLAQMIALRFASDAELPSLAERAKRESMTGKQIKQAIGSWRADNYRV